MNKKLIKLFADLDRFWNISSSPNLKGEHPNCMTTAYEIKEELVSLGFKKADKILKELTDEQIEQIISVVEEIIDEMPETADTFKQINEERNIHWLNDELKLLGIIE